MQPVERHEQAEAGHRAHRAAVFLAQVLAHVAALEPGLDVARGLVGAPLVGAAMGARHLPGLELAARNQGRRRGQLGLRRLRGLGMLGGVGCRVVGLVRQLVALAFEQGLDDAMHEQVRVAPDRAREVRVGLVGQAEVAAVGAGVDRLLHRTQQHRVDLRGVGPVFRGLGDGLVFGRLGIVADRQAQPERLQVVLQQRLLFRRRPFMDAVERRVLGADDEIGRTDVGGQHRLFDQAVRLGAGARHDLFDPAVLVADDLRLGGLEVDCAALDARLQQRPVDIVQIEQVRHQCLPLRRLGTPGVGQDGCNLFVGEARRRANRRREELIGVNLAFGGDEHVADHRQPLDIGVERAQAVRELLGQHRQDPAREIDRGRALVGVGVERLARLHIVADVGDGDDEAPAVRHLRAPDLGRLAVHGVVEIARVFAVDGDECDVAEVDAVPAIGGSDRLGQGRRLRQRGVGKDVRHLVLAHRDLDLHAGIVDLSQHFGDPSERLRMQRWRLGELDGDDLARRGAGDGVARHDDVLAVAPVLRRHQPDAAFVQQAADDRCLLALDDVEQPALGPALLVVADDAHLDAILVQDRAHLLRR